MTVLSGIVVIGLSLFLLGLAVVIATKPSVAERFLLSFASSARAHYMEQGVRLLVGAAVIQLAGSTRFPELFQLFGWLVLVTTVGLLLIPWRWHHQFAARVMPPLIRHKRLFALGAFVLATFILYSVSAVASPP